MNLSSRLDKIEKYIKSTLPDPKQAAVAQMLRDFAQKIKDDAMGRESNK